MLQRIEKKESIFQQVSTDQARVREVA